MTVNSANLPNFDFTKTLWSNRRRSGEVEPTQPARLDHPLAGGIDDGLVESLILQMSNSTNDTDPDSSTQPTRLARPPTGRGTPYVSESKNGTNL